MNRSFLAGMIVGGTLLAVGMALGGAQPAQPDAIPILRAQRIEIVDELGTATLVLGSNTFGGSLSVRNRFGKSVLLGSATADGSTLLLKDASAATTLADFTTYPEGGSLQLYRTDGARILHAGIDNARSSFTLFNEQSKPLARLGQMPPGHGMIETFSAQGERLVALSATPAAQGEISTHAPDGQALVRLTASAGDEGQMYTYAQDGRVLIAAATSALGATLRIYNSAAEAVVTLGPDEQNDGAVGVWRADGQGRQLRP